ncbi:hypothetical protein Clacol_001372 [Clathrus columnatus]|uniref:3-isopropylmalate dehydrogenase n=1 Tax=Clathrus columnatus TaxID=1419009 RepID=A0AAV4ZY50_9AGAM|nr:hypothetical protein Clacol_001372 [Clathrus columnatus]
MKSFKVVILPGPEVINQAVRVLQVVAERNIGKFELHLETHLIGGAAIEATGHPLPDSTFAACKAADAVLLGSVGGYKWGVDAPVRPETGLLTLRKELNLYANIRPANFASDSLLSCSPLKENIAKGVNFIVVRELIGGAYFGERKEAWVEPRPNVAWDNMIYSVEEVQRITRVAAQLALTTNPPMAIHSIDKANVLATSRLWRRVVTETLRAEYPQIPLDHHYVDAAAMVMVSNPRKLNGVILTENLFGDILSDQSSVIPGSLGLLPSASLSAPPTTGGETTFGLYEPIHGSAPDIAGQGIANPIGTILSAAMLLRYSLGLEKEASAVELAVRTVLDDKNVGGLGLRTKDLGGEIYGTHHRLDIVPSSFITLAFPQISKFNLKVDLDSKLICLTALLIILLMLATKRVNTYGKRSSRIVSTSTENKTSFKSPMKQLDENTVVDSPSSPKKLLRWGRKVKGHSTSPRGSPKAGNLFRLASKKPLCKDGPNLTPQRQPLGVKSSSILSSPSIVYLGTRTPQVAQKQTTFTPFVDSEIVSIDIEDEPRQPKKQSSRPGRGTKLTEITNVSTTEEEQPIRGPRQRGTRRPIIISDNENEDTTDNPVPVSNIGLQHTPIFISDDDDDDSDLEFLPNITRPNRRKDKPAPFCHAKPKPRNETQSQPPKPPRRVASLRRQLQLQDSRLALKDQLHIESSLTEIEELSISSRDSGKTQRGSRLCKNSLPSELQYLSGLLAECSQNAPHNFESFIESFPTNEIFGAHPPARPAFRKLGEASYSEVFVVGDIVLKVIPLRNEIAPQLANDDIDLPYESDCKDVLQEIIITRELGKKCPGFITLLRTFIVVGDYSPQLLALWDEYNSQKESENIRPDVFPKSQAYALVVLPNGGPDLESYRFPLKAAWRQACSVFWQTAKALAIAEESVSFEHRDLHWGQILVKSTGHSSPKRRSKQHEMLPMDHPLLGISVTIIDMGLARMNAINCKDKIYWTPFDDVIFEGEGDDSIELSDYQFDVYRMMKEVHSDGCWDKFRPVTNVMWLHYLLVKLLRAKGMRPPSIRNIVPGTSELNERICYDGLVEMESLLESSIMYSRGKKNRNDRTRLTFSNAGDVHLMANYIRKIVSGNKERFRDDELDMELDLVYVTDHVIIMGFPAEGFEGFYRNRREDARKFLDHRHKDSYWIFNFCPLTENSYDEQFFYGRVSRYPFPDHHAPPLAILPLAVREMRTWLTKSKDNIIVLHCKAGKGRSGTLACAYLLSLDVTPAPPKLQRSYTAKQWAKLRAEEWMDVVQTEDMPVDERGPDPEAKDTTEEFRAPVGEGELLSSRSATPDRTATPSTGIAKVKSLPDISKSGGNEPLTGTALERVLALHSSRRMKPRSTEGAKTRQGVSIPSQRRFLLYWSLLLSNSGPPHFWTLNVPTNDSLRKPKVKIHQLTVRLRDPGGAKMTLVKAVNKVLEQTSSANAGYSQGLGNVWASFSRYDDEFVNHIEEWEKLTRSHYGRLGKRREDQECKGVDEIFKSGKWDNAKMVRGFAKFGRTDRNIGVETVNAVNGADTVDKSKSRIHTHVLTPLDQYKWTVVKKKINAESNSTALTDIPNEIRNEHSDGESTSLDDTEQMSVPGEEMRVSDDSGVILDAGREVRVKIFLGQVFMGWFWFIPTFHMPQPPPSEGSASPVHWLLTRKDVDFPLGIGASIVDIDLEMSWVPFKRNSPRDRIFKPPIEPSSPIQELEATTVPTEH